MWNSSVTLRKAVEDNTLAKKSDSEVPELFINRSILVLGIIREFLCDMVEPHQRAVQAGIFCCIHSIGICASKHGCERLKEKDPRNTIDTCKCICKEQEEQSVSNTS
ncbi:hypothetical protein EVAR_8360_1 [Eumeta japonica]|uniref:Uncharacterized protein n=1 Tax=Eumeta variegata TaxID=151549 RepID=A0A4C1VE61_EUMVA|nr:hypothetical protein EVAR_8360_1 [Eumeta japonica]